jgi:hypothetical protein
METRFNQSCIFNLKKENDEDVSSDEEIRMRTTKKTFKDLKGAFKDIQTFGLYSVVDNFNL